MTGNGDSGSRRPRGPEEPGELERLERRRRILLDLGVEETSVDELLALDRRNPPGEPAKPLPLADEAHLAAWREYEEEAGTEGVVGALERRFFQLGFPVAEGISASPDYRRASRQGVFSPAGSPGLDLVAPEELRLSLHPTPAGTLPVVRATRREDFVALVRAFVGRNEPVLVPRSMGACLVKGFNNWDRIRRYRDRWEAGRGAAGDGGAWPEEFRRLRRHKELYQDRFLILREGPYSGVPASSTGFSDAEWRSLSGVIRLEHECAHYVALRVYGVLFDRVVDEIVADLAGLTAALGRFRPDLALLFLGLEDGERFRPGGRLENYQGERPLSADAFRWLCRLAREAIGRLAKVSTAIPDDPLGRARLVVALSRFSLEELAAGVDLGALTIDAPQAAVAASERVLSLSASRNGVIEGLEALSSFLERSGAPDETRRALLIVADEAMSNIWKYAYPEEAGGEEGRMDLTLRALPGEIEVEIVDEGIRYDPSLAVAPDPGLPLAERPIGGLGLHLIRELCDRIEYARRDGRNRLTFARAMKPDATTAG